jgi:uncharacterized membrane protein YcfT
MNTSSSNLIIIGAVLLLLLICYIVSLVLSKKGKMILTKNGWDMAMLLACPVALFVAWCWGFDHPLNTVQYVFLSIAGLCFIGTTIMSIISNMGNWWGMMLSILAKVFIVWLTLFIILLLITLLIIFVILTFVKGNDKDEYILLKYDRSLRAYVGYRYYE